MKNEYCNIKDYLQVIHPILMKGYLWTALVMIDIVGIPTILVGSTGLLYKAMLIPIIIINIWILVILFDVVRWQKLYILYVGIFSFLMSVIFLMTSYRFYMLNTKSNQSLFLAISIIVYLLIFIFGIVFHIKALEKGYYSLEYQSKFNKYGGLMAIAPASGLILGKIFFAQIEDDQDLVVLVLSGLFLFLGYIIELGIHNIYKYYLMRRYKDEIKTFTLPRKRSKKRIK